MIKIIGPNWPSVRALQQALAEAPENGELRWASGHANKLEQLRLLAAANLAVVPTTEDIIEASQWVKDGERVFGRRYHHTQGKDIVTQDQRRQWQRRDFWTKHVPSQEEWRIHIFDGKSICRSKKVLAEAAIDDSTPLQMLVRSWDNGWRFHHGPKPPKGLRAFAKEMVKACGYLFGACDILVKEDGGFCALEVNTGPSCEGKTLAAYVKAIRGYFNARA